MSVSIGGPPDIDYSGTFAYYASVGEEIGPFTYLWQDRSTSKDLTVYFDVGLRDYTRTLTLQVYDQGAGTTSTATKTIFVHGEGSACGGDIPC